MTKVYNNHVRDVYGLAAVKGEVGIEIECEGQNLIHGNKVGTYWSHHRDQSLRGEDNAEYVLTKPVLRDDVRESLEELFGLLKEHGSKLRKDSPTTSVHVHLNVQDWSLKKVYGLICLWYILEQPLVEFASQDRVGNLFCLRGSDAEYALQRLCSAARYGKYHDLGDKDGLRYLAMNYTSLATFGSLEFRALPGVYDIPVITRWVDILLAVKDFAGRFDFPPEIISEYSRLGAQAFFESVFQKDNLWKVIPFKVNDLHAGMRMIQNVAYCVNWEKGDPQPVKKPKPKEVGVAEARPLDVELQGGINRPLRVRLPNDIRQVGPVPEPVDVNPHKLPDEIKLGEFVNWDIMQNRVGDWHWVNKQDGRREQIGDRNDIRNMNGVRWV